MFPYIGYQGQGAFLIPSPKILVQKSNPSYIRRNAWRAYPSYVGPDNRPSIGPLSQIKKIFIILSPIEIKINFDRKTLSIKLYLTKLSGKSFLWLYFY